MTDYLRIECILPASAEDELPDVLSGFPVLGADLEPGGTHQIRVGVWIGDVAGGLAARVERALKGHGATAVVCRARSDEDWEAAWRSQLRPFEVGRRWWIDPNPDQPTAPPRGRHRLAVEPRAAFGSGTHESTRLVLMEIEEIDCRNRRLLDAGTGSGILAVAADRLGAARVVALDIDTLAAWEARNSARCQDFESRLLVVAGPVDCLGPAVFDVVLCNMISSNFKPLLGSIVRLLAPDGIAIFSGILEPERRSVEAALLDNGLIAVGGRAEGDWISIRSTLRTAAS